MRRKSGGESGAVKRNVSACAGAREVCRAETGACGANAAQLWKNFTEGAAADRLGLAHENDFEIGALAFGGNKGIACLEAAVGGKYAAYDFEVSGVVRGDMDFAAVPESSVNRVQEARVEQPAAVVAALRPGVGEKQVVGPYASSGDQRFDGLAVFAANEAYVFKMHPQRGALDLGDPHPAAVYAQEAGLTACERAGKQEAPLAAPEVYLQLKRARAVKRQSKIEELVRVFGLEHERWGMGAVRHE